LKNKGFDVKFEMPNLLDKSYISHLQDWKPTEFLHILNMFGN
jgi:hypothetical protein